LPSITTSPEASWESPQAPAEGSGSAMIISLSPDTPKALGELTPQPTRAEAKELGRAREASSTECDEATREGSQ